MLRTGMIGAIAAAALIGLAGPARADLVHQDGVREIHQQAPTGTVAGAFGNGR